MSTATQDRRSLPAAMGDAATGTVHPGWIPLVLGILGTVAALLVGSDGSWGWRLIRVTLVVALTIGTMRVWAAAGRSGAWTALAAGSIGLVLGIGFGLRYSAASAITWKGGLGLTALPSGVILVAAGTRRLLAGRRPGSRTAITLGLVLVVALFVWTVTPAVLATNVPPTSHGTSTPGDYGMTAQEVTFPASDGTLLWAWYVPSRNGAAVVLRHGAGSDASRALPQAQVLARHGYGVLITDARGHGLSDGRAMDFGWYGDADITGAVSFLASQPEVNPGRIGVLGLSMGGEEAIGAAAADPRIKAVVAEGATARTEEDKTWFADVYGLRGRIQLGLEWVQYTLVDLMTEASKPTPLAGAVETAGRPIFLITAGEAPDEGHAAEHLRQRSPGRVNIWTVPGAGHTQGLSVDPQGWEARVIGFLDSILGR